jgi:ligand-binding sensor domain-containing protein
MLFGGNKKKQSLHPRRLTLSIAFIFFLALFSKGERLPIKTYTVADGLLRDNVYKIKQDSRGFLWFCTVEGISRFDGYTFTNFTVADGLPDRRVNDFLETKDGSIYMATDKGLAKLNPTGIHHSIRETKSEIPNSNNPLFTVEFSGSSGQIEINRLFEDENGLVFVGTSHGLYRLNEKAQLEVVNLVESPAKADQPPITAIIRDRRGALWVGTRGSGLFRILPSGETEQFTEKNGLPDRYVSALHEDKNNRIWVGLSPNNVSGLLTLVARPEKNQNIVERHYRQKEGLPADWITDLYETDAGQFLVGTTGGLCLWQGGENSVCKIYTGANDACDAEVWSITEDKDKNLWLGTRCGAKKWKRYGFTTYTEADGTGYPLANSIFENSAGDLFASFNNGGAGNKPSGRTRRAIGGFRPATDFYVSRSRLALPICQKSSRKKLSSARNQRRCFAFLKIRAAIFGSRRPIRCGNYGAGSGQPADGKI